MDWIGENIMTTMDILSQMQSGKLSVEEATKMIEAQSKGGSKKTTVAVKEFKGNIILEFSGNFKPFSLGKGKLGPIMEMEGTVKQFLATGKV